jgi:hypothetical protein
MREVAWPWHVAAAEAGQWDGRFAGAGAGADPPWALGLSSAEARRPRLCSTGSNPGSKVRESCRNWAQLNPPVSTPYIPRGPGSVRLGVEQSKGVKEPAFPCTAPSTVE